MAYQFIEVQPGRVTQIALNRPERRNAIGRVMEDELIAAFREADEDERCSVILLSGRGAMFCAGHDIKEQAADPEETARQAYRDLSRRSLQEEAWRTLKPIIAAV